MVDPCQTIQLSPRQSPASPRRPPSILHGMSSKRKKMLAVLIALVLFGYIIHRAAEGPPDILLDTRGYPSTRPWDTCPRGLMLMARTSS